MKSINKFGILLILFVAACSSDLDQPKADPLNGKVEVTVNGMSDTLSDFEAILQHIVRDHDTLPGDTTPMELTWLSLNLPMDSTILRLRMNNPAWEKQIEHGLITKPYYFKESHIRCVNVGGGYDCDGGWAYFGFLDYGHEREFIPRCTDEDDHIMITDNNPGARTVSGYFKFDVCGRLWVDGKLIERIEINGRFKNIKYDSYRH